MRRGKYLQIGAGSRSRSQARAEDSARRSRKRASERDWKQLADIQEFLGEREPSFDSRVFDSITEVQSDA